MPCYLLSSENDSIDVGPWIRVPALSVISLAVAALHEDTLKYGDATIQLFSYLFPLLFSFPFSSFDITNCGCQLSLLPPREIDKGSSQKTKELWRQVLSVPWCCNGFSYRLWRVYSNRRHDDNAQNISRPSITSWSRTYGTVCGLGCLMCSIIMISNILTTLHKLFKSLKGLIMRGMTVWNWKWMDIGKVLDVKILGLYQFMRLSSVNFQSRWRQLQLLSFIQGNLQLLT